MPADTHRLLRVLAAVALAPFLAGAHCSEECGKPATSNLARPMERTLYGPGLLVVERGALLGEALGPYDKRALRIDPSRPVAVLLASSSNWAELGRLDASQLKPGDRGPAFEVVGVLDHAGKLPLFEGAGAIDRAKRAGWDAVVLLPRTPGPGPWECAVSVEMGRTVKTVRDEKTDACITPAAAGGSAPSFALASLPVRCGDGVRQQEEECDDGNRRPGDGCSAFCTKER